MSRSSADLLEQAASAVAEAGERIRADFHKPKNVRLKGRIDLVTDTDMAVEALLKQRLKDIVPESDFLAEETSDATVPGQATWIIDPVDGTTNFAHGLPFVATSVALWQDGRCRLGIVNLPILGQMFTAVAGEGAWRDGKPIRVSRETELKNALVATGFPYDIEKYTSRILDNLSRVLPATRGLRRPGSAAADLAYVAAGVFDAFYESALNPWDTAAGWLLVEEAGGRVATYDGAPYSLDSETILACAPQFLADLCGLLTT